MDEIRFDVRRPPSLKNGKILSRGQLRTSTAVKRAMRDIRAAARAAIGAAGVEQPAPKASLWGSAPVAIEMVHEVESDTVRVVVKRLRPSGERSKAVGDLQNLQDTLCDALQRLVYHDDCQVDALSMVREYPEE